MRDTIKRFISLLLTAGLSLGVAAGCADAVPEVESPVETPDDGLGLDGANLGSVLASCSTAGSSGFDAETKTLTLALGGGVTEIVISVPNKVLAVNYNPCVDSTGAALTTTAVQKIVVNGTTGDDTVILDIAPGSFGGVFSSKGGVTVDLGAGTADAFKARGSNSGSDRFTAGTVGSDHYFELSGDRYADVKVIGGEDFVVALGDGADTFTGEGGAISGAHIDAAATALDPFGADLVVNGGAGKDIITGGAGDDTLSGGADDDTFKTAVTDDGSDTYAGGAGTDTMDYSSRTGDLTVTLDGTGNDGLTGEADNLGVDVENVTGGAGDDTITGSDVSNKIVGGAGDDTLSGGTGNADCALDVDVLDGGAGVDTFDQGTAADCGDTMIGGAGIDTASYVARTNSVTVSLNNAADDGETNEADNAKTDIEILVGGDGDDVLTGGSGADTLAGGAGDDTLNGAAGDDTFDQGSADSGSDILNGGAGTDTVDYSARTVPVIVTLCVDAAASTGDSSAGDCATKNDGEAGEVDQIINCEGVLGGTGADIITGAASDDTLEGGDGADIIDGGDGADSIFGDAGADVLDGGAGDDYIDGGADVNTVDGGAGDGDICTQAGTPTNCEL